MYKQVEQYQACISKTENKSVRCIFTSTSAKRNYKSTDYKTMHVSSIKTLKDIKTLFMLR